LKQFVLDRLGHDRRYAMDTGRVLSLGWGPQISLDDGLAGTVSWYQKRQDWWRPLKSAEFWEFYRRNYRANPASGPVADQDA